MKKKKKAFKFEEWKEQVTMDACRSKRNCDGEDIGDLLAGAAGSVMAIDTDENNRCTVFTIGYGGRSKEEFAGLLNARGIRTVVDVRFRPNRAYRGTWVKAKSPDKGIEQWLPEYGLEYCSMPELGNKFMDEEDWATPFQVRLQEQGDVLTKRLREVDGPVVLMCAEKRACECHRQYVADYLQKSWNVKVCHLQ